MHKEYKGLNGTLILGERGLKIKRSTVDKWMTRGKTSGTKVIPYRMIVAVQFKKPSFFTPEGYIQFTIMGGEEAHGGVKEAFKDENSVNFLGSQTKQFMEAKEFIEDAILGLE